jgi:hypothetical protein
MPPFLAKVNRGITAEWKKWSSPNPFMVPDLLHKFQMICLRGIEVIERKLNMELTVGNLWL